MAVHYVRTAHCAFDQATITTMYVRCWKACYVTYILLYLAYQNNGNLILRPMFFALSLQCELAYCHGQRIVMYLPHIF